MLATYYHGVLSAKGILYYSVDEENGKRHLYVIPTDVSTVPDMLDLAYEHRIHTLWVCPNHAYLTQAEAVDNAGRWDIKPSFTRVNSGEVVRSATGRKLEGSWLEKRQITITFPSLTPYQWDEMAESNDPVSCLAAIHYSEEALGIKLHHNPGITGRHVIIDTNNAHTRTTWTRKPTFDLSLLSNSVGYDFAYQRGIDPTDITGVLYLDGWDKNGMYLAAASSCYLGVGDPVYVSGLALLEDNQHLERWYDGKKPGYWHIKVEEPMVLNPLYKGQEWVTTPLLRLLYAMGVNVKVLEAYVWPEYKRVLDKFATRLWDARHSLKTDRTKYPHEGGRQLAYYSMKRIATSTIGLLGSPDTAQYTPQWFRPDWRATVVEEAKARLFFKLLQVERSHGVLPLAVAVDAVYYLSVEPDPAKAFGDMFVNDDKLGGWKLQLSIPATYSVLACFKPGVSAGAAIKGVRTIIERKQRIGA